MATSLHACYPNSCRNPQQIKNVTKSPNVVRRSQSTRQYNTANRRSAVERLEESKANYVKSERVLDTKQEFKNSSHLRVTTAPTLDILYKNPAKFSPENVPKLSQNTPDDVKLSFLRSQNQTTTSRTRAKSHSEFRSDGGTLTRKHSFASQGRRNRIEVLIDIETQLRQLITSGSRENVSRQYGSRENVSRQYGSRESISRHYGSRENVLRENVSNDLQTTPRMSSEAVPKVRRGYSDPVRKSYWVPPDLSPDANFIHKSMPDLTPSPVKPCLSLSSGESNDVETEERVPVVVPKQKPNINVVQVEDDGFDPMIREPRRFSNGTGMLHLTPYYSATSQLQRKPVSRSKSDVSHRYSKRGSEYFPRRNNYTTAEIERFFDTMGLDTNAWHHVTSPSLVSSPPCFFESISSIDSNDDRNTESSDESLPGVPKEGLRNHDLRIHGPLETSIVEKNARVIKWLYNCRKASPES